MSDPFSFGGQTSTPAPSPAPAFTLGNAPVTQSSGRYNPDVAFNKQAAAPEIRAYRDKSGEQGGGFAGNIQSTIYSYVITGESKNYEWPLYSQLHNYSKDGENCAAYFKAEKYNTGATWGAVSEVCDITGTEGWTVGHEVDCWTAGKDTGTRFGVDVVLGDAPYYRGKGRTEVVEGSAGIRIGPRADTLYARWTRGIQFLGKLIVGIDLSTAQTETAVRLSAGQMIAFNEYDQLKFGLKNNMFGLFVDGQEVFTVDPWTGDIFKRGRKVL